MVLEGTFTAEESRVYQALLFVYTADAHTLKEQTDEAVWLSRYEWFYDEVNSIVEDHGGSVVKYTVDGAIAVFAEDGAADAINAAIGLQESLSDQHRRIELTCSTGIATGEVLAFQDPQGRTDYIGEVVDRASQLCASASPKAVWVDRETVMTALMRKVRSRVGADLRRSPDAYQGEPQKIWLKGLGPVEYHEIVWDQAPFGVKSATVTEELETRSREKAGQATNVGRREDRTRGTLVHWNSAKHIGLIESDDGVQYFVGDRYLVSEEIPQTGTDVWFTPLPAKREGDNPIAGCAVPVGARLTGYVAKIIPDKPFGFVEVEDRLGNLQELFWYFGTEGPDLAADDFVEFMVGENDRGPLCTDVSVVPED